MVPALLDPDAYERWMDPSKAAYVTADGALKGNSAKSSYSYRPILVLPQEVLVDESGNVIG